MDGKNETLYYTYLDECKRNYLTELMNKQTGATFQEYSITSLTFKKEEYQDKFEKEWEDLRKKYKIDSKKAMHFVEYKKLILPELRTAESVGFETFLVEGEFSEELLKNFFKDLKKILEANNFFIVHTDYFWEKAKYLTKRNQYNRNQFKKETSNIAPEILNAVPYVAMRKHLDSLMQTLLKKEIKDEQVEDGEYFDVELPGKIYTKLRFDADGKEFDARNDLKKAYNHTISIGSDNVKSKVSTEILDEIRFIRKEEVGHDFIPNHCGLEVVDFLCSMIAGETRLKKYVEIGRLNYDENIKEGCCINLKFSDGTVIEFDKLLNERIRYHTINYLSY